MTKSSHPAKSTRPAKQTAKKTGRAGRLAFTGFSMGLADLVPGVSGGTVAFLYGIYDELLYSIKHVSGTVPKLILQGKISQAWKEIPWAFLLPLAAGIFTAIFGLAGVVSFLLDEYPLFIWSVFFGLVLGSCYVVSKRVSHWNYNRIALLLLGLVLTYLVIGLPEQTGEPTTITIFFTGVVAFCAMILPGISGSLIMLILGQYHHVLDAAVERNFGLLFTLALGGAVGLSVFSRLLSWLLKTHHGASVAFLIGMMLGSLRKVWPWHFDNSGQLIGSGISMNVGVLLLLSAVLVLFGFWLVWKLEQTGIATEHQDIDDPEFLSEQREQKNL